jgi:NAD(P)-dependent dehydrogenase (short-subunit alcohol dehydrogenase family)
MSTYVVTGATGHTGRPIALGLLAAGHAVRIVSRSADKAKELTAKGAALFAGDASDAELLARAFEGADAAYLMVPSDYRAPDYTGWQIAHATAMAEAASKAGLPGSGARARADDRQARPRVPPGDVRRGEAGAAGRGLRRERGRPHERVREGHERGRVLSAHRRDAEATTPTTLEDFAPAFKPVYLSQGGTLA